jgi:hypothetical protein
MVGGGDILFLIIEAKASRPDANALPQLFLELLCVCFLLYINALC